MSVFLWLPVVLLGAVFFIVCAVGAAVELAERRRLAALAAAASRRRGFRPVVIEGGRRDWPGAAENGRLNTLFK